MDTKHISEFEGKIKYVFENREFLFEALRHSSFVNEQADNSLRNNERFEFLGDAVINLVVGHGLMVHFPNINEGDLSRMRASLVNETQLAGLARNIHLGDYIQLGKGELLSNGQEKNSILADAFEALVAAVYLDGGFTAAERFVGLQIRPLFSNAIHAEIDQDFKSRLQECLQSDHKAPPSYNIVAEEGPDHDKTFQVELQIDTLTVIGIGKSKKAAEQDAAQKALKNLSAKNP